MTKCILDDKAVALLQELIGGDTPVLEDVEVTPTTAAQTIVHGQGYDGIGTVTVKAVTSAIDSDIVPENIKKDVDILGVVGTLE